MDKSTIIKILSKFRYLFIDLSYGDNVILQKINDYTPSNYMVFPCDVIDLRKILTNKEIEFNGDIPLFSQEFAKNSLKRYSLFLVIDISKIDKDSFKYGGLCILRDNKLDVSNSLIRIIINKQVDDNTFDIVQNMIKELNIYIECIVENSIPGISSTNPKLSNLNNFVLKYSQNRIGTELEPELFL